MKSMTLLFLILICSCQSFAEVSVKYKINGIEMWPYQNGYTVRPEEAVVKITDGPLDKDASILFNALAESAVFTKRKLSFNKFLGDVQMGGYVECAKIPASVMNCEINIYDPNRLVDGPGGKFSLRMPLDSHKSYDTSAQEILDGFKIPVGSGEIIIFYESSDKKISIKMDRSYGVFLIGIKK